jgi:membrane protein implicated in regulation of membrane protease activity
MPTILSQALKIVFNPETILPFLVGSVFLAVFGNAIYDILKNLLGTSTPGLVKIAIVSLLILVMAIALVSWTIVQRIASLPNNVPFEVQQKTLERQYKGLILLVSNVEACEAAIRFHVGKLQRCWLICSSQTLEQAKDLSRRYAAICLDQPIIINDIYDPLEFRNCIHALYQQRLPKDWQAADIITDYTGMTAHASVGAVMACFGTTRPLQYTPARTNDQGKITGSLNPIRVILMPPHAQKA